LATGNIPHKITGTNIGNLSQVEEQTLKLPNPTLGQSNLGQLGLIQQREQMFFNHIMGSCETRRGAKPS